jgi:hypothetical protein
MNWKSTAATVFVAAAAVRAFVTTSGGAWQLEDMDTPDGHQHVRTPRQRRLRADRIMNPLVGDEDLSNYVATSVRRNCARCHEHHSPYEPCHFCGTLQPPMMLSVIILLSMPAAVVGIIIFGIIFAFCNAN